MILTIALALAAVENACRRDPADWSASPERTELLAALGGVRPAEGRLAGSRHALFASSAAMPTMAKVIEVVRKIEKGSSTAPFPRRLGDLALVALVKGRPQEAVRHLEKAVGETPTDMGRRNDLAVAYLARHELHGQPYDLVLALSALLEIVQTNPDSGEALFNLALTLEKLGIRDEARAVWTRVAALERGNAWGDEAGERSRALDRPSELDLWWRGRTALNRAALAGDQAAVAKVVSRHPQQAREYAEDELLGAWAEAMVKGDLSGAARALMICRSIGSALAHYRGETMVRDAVAAIDRALAGPKEAQTLERLIAGHEAYRRGRREYDDFQNEQALQSLKSAGELLERGGSPFAAWAGFFTVASLYRLSEYPAALDALARLEQTSEGYRSLLGRLGWVRGLIHFAQGEFTAALLSYESALTDFLECGEPGNAGTIHHLLSEAFAVLGENGRAWHHLHAALQATDSILDPLRLQVIFQGAALVATRQGTTRAGLRFQDEAVRAAQRSREPTAVAEALALRASMRAGQGRLREAYEDIAAARAAVGQVPDSLRRTVLGDLLLVEGDMRRVENPRAAVQQLSESLQIFRETNYQYKMVRALRARGLANVAAGLLSAGESDLWAGIQEVEAQRRRVISEQLRISFFDRMDVLFDELLALLHTSKRSDKEVTFRLAEAGRARVLLDLMEGTDEGQGTRTPRTAKVAEVQRTLPADGVLIEYALLPDRLLIWVLTKDRFEYRYETTGSQRIERAVEELRTAIVEEGNPQKVRKSLLDLSELIIRPVEDLLAGRGTIVFVPDKGLHAVPFGALVTPKTQRYLVEDHVIVKAPSATVYLKCALSERRSGTDRPPRMLAVGGPSFDRAMFPHLPTLPGAREEAERIARLYPGSLLLPAEKATKRAFLEAVGEHEIVHFAGHALDNREFPLLSRFLFVPAPGESGSGILWAHELYSRRFPRTRLVVLSACDSAAGSQRWGEGAENLARPFLAAGVPAVIGGLWKVEDRAAAALFSDFYLALKTGIGPAQALRSAQLKALAQQGSRTSSPRHWAAFELIGGT